MHITGFDWDSGNIQKCQKHGVSIAEIEYVLLNNPMTLPDIAHSQDELRQLTIGMNASGKYVFIATTIRVNAGKRYIRPISARYMHKKEINNYKKYKYEK